MTADILKGKRLPVSLEIARDWTQIYILPNALLAFDHASFRGEHTRKQSPSLPLVRSLSPGIAEKWYHVYRENLSISIGEKERERERETERRRRSKKKAREDDRKPEFSVRAATGARHLHPSDNTPTTPSRGPDGKGVRDQREGRKARGTTEKTERDDSRHERRWQRDIGSREREREREKEREREREGVGDWLAWWIVW